MYEYADLSLREIDDLLATATEAAFAALQQTWECDTGLFWKTIDADDLFIWLCEDHPKLAASIWRWGLQEEFGKRIAAAGELMRDAERIVREMDDALITSVACASPDAQKHSLYACIEERGGYSDDHCVYFEPEPADYYAPEAPGLDGSWRGGGPGYGARATATVAREALRIILGRYERVIAAGQRNGKPLSQSWATNESCPVIDEIRCGLTPATTFYVLAECSLPSSLRGRTSERRCLAARVSDQWLDHPELLAKPGCLTYHAVKQSRSPIPLDVWGLSNNALWLDASAALEPIRRCRTTLPVLYVGSTTCRLVNHNFAHWAELSRVTGGQTNTMSSPHSAEVIDENARRTVLPDGTVLLPSLKRNLADLSSS
ncbi:MULTISPECIES: hypothetical protein [Paraburkholderia]|uniref:Uncharacterized protein n=1 Tax=Paraburkholderia podalyriae TaxID=1938811 RepID=A0ABR7PQR5_9BURK|nr:hypothetical protein [Paraburkholderia podalyriae]MBC8748587.1 hypothetical protein [Paraburkholderia podalyriae]